MEIITLFLVLILARFTVRGLFDKQWVEKSQDIVACIKDERVFWNSMRVSAWSPETVFWLYVRRLAGESNPVPSSSAYDFSDKQREEKSFINNTIRKKNGCIKNVNLLNEAILQREAVIKECLEKNQIVFTDTEIKETFEKIKDITNAEDVSKEYAEFIQARLNSLTKGEQTGVSVWTILKEVDDDGHRFEYDATGDKRISRLKRLKTAQIMINAVLADLLYETMGNEYAAQQLQKALTEWGQLHMLRWCIVDQAVRLGLLNGIKRVIWRFVEAAC